MKLKPIGVIHSPYAERGDAPFQGRMESLESKVEVFEEFAPALKDVEHASHLFILYWADKADREILQTNTPHDTDKSVLHGVFATRSPNRPNPINLGIVDLVRREENVLIVKGLDALDQSTLVDIKPYHSKLDAIVDAAPIRFKEKE